MGGDGGSIPRRTDLVKPKKKPESANKEASNIALWKYCSLSQDSLRLPIVSCRLGRLYNKEAIINKLLNKERLNSNADHIHKLKDVKELNLYSGSSVNLGSETSTTNSNSTFYCPITGLEMSGLHAFIFLWSCGCVFSKKAFSAVQDNFCMMCGTVYTPEDVILINPQKPEDVRAAQARLQAHQSSSSKSRKRPVPSSSSAAAAVATTGPSESASKTETAPDPDEDKSKKKKLETLDLQSTSETETTTITLVESSKSFKSIQEDPSVSTVYKSLFTTSKEAKRQPKPHWVTFNPLYFR